MNLLKVRACLVLFLIIFLLTPGFIESQTNNDNDIAKGIQLFEAKKFSDAKKFFD